jgi:cytochrome c556
MARQLTDAAKGLENAATAERPQAMQAFAALAKTCSTCHTDFRKKKE